MWGKKYGSRCFFVQWMLGMLEIIWQVVLLFMDLIIVFILVCVKWGLQGLVLIQLLFRNIMVLWLVVWICFISLVMWDVMNLCWKEIQFWKDLWGIWKGELYQFLLMKFLVCNGQLKCFLKVFIVGIEMEVEQLNQLMKCLVLLELQMRVKWQKKVVKCIMLIWGLLVSYWFKVWCMCCQVWGQWMLQGDFLICCGLLV